MSFSSSSSDNSDNESQCSDYSVRIIQNSDSISDLIDNLQSINIESDMAHAKFKTEFLQIIPEFTGNQALLSEFITTSEQLINKFYNINDANDFQNTFLLRSIKNKIKGEAAEAIASYNILTSADLKTALLATYSDKRDL